MIVIRKEQMGALSSYARRVFDDAIRTLVERTGHPGAGCALQDTAAIAAALVDRAVALGFYEADHVQRLLTYVCHHAIDLDAPADYGSVQSVIADASLTPSEKLGWLCAHYAKENAR